MLTKITIKNFKKLDSINIELGPAVVFVGPNNSGKTSALQAIALWELGMRKWAEKRKKSKAQQRTAVVINRRDILATPVPSAKQLWRNLHTHEASFIEGKQKTKNIRIEICAEGYTDGKKWYLGFEFDYDSSETIFCRIIKDEKTGLPMDFPEEALKERVGLLPPMSGLAAEEDRLQLGSIQSRIGQGITAEVLRNLCWIISSERKDKWGDLVKTIKELFNVEILEPIYNETNGQISMTYKEGNTEMDLSNAGRGFHQILLLFSYIYAGNNTILLLDEPDAHLEIIRQEEIYNKLSEIVKSENSQLIIGTHSEIVLREAAGKDKVIAFLGKPHVVNDKSQLVKSLTSIGFDQYLLAEQKGRVLYLEGSTDLSMLKSFADVLEHPVRKYLNDSFIKYVCNVPSDARNHYHGLKEAEKSLKGVALFDYMENVQLIRKPDYDEIMWNRKEIENYLPIPEVIERFMQQQPADLFNDISILKQIINDNIPPIALKERDHKWWKTTKMSDDFLDIVFKEYFKKLRVPNLINKGSYYKLALLARKEELDSEIKDKLDFIYDVLKKK